MDSKIVLNAEIQDYGQCEVTVRVPGLMFADVNWNVLGRSSKICDLFEAGLLLPCLQMSAPSFALCDPRLQEYKFISYVCDYDIQERLHTDIASIPHFYVHSSICSYTNDSFVMKQTLTCDDASNTNTYATSLSHFQFVKKGTHQIVPLPEFFANHLKGVLKTSVRVHGSSLPRTSHIAHGENEAQQSFCFNLQPSDFDRPGTSSDSMLVRQCMNTARLWAKTATHGTFPLNYVKRIQGEYFGKMDCHGELNVTVNTLDGQFHFKLTDAQTYQHIANFTIQFFSASKNSLNKGPPRVEGGVHSVGGDQFWAIDSTSCASCVPISNDSFNLRTGEVIPWRLLLLGQTHRMCLLRTTLTDALRKLWENNVALFVVASNFTISPRFHSYAQQSSTNVVPTLIYLNSVGSSSFDMGYTQKFGGKVVLTSQTRIVVVDQTTRKPSKKIKELLPKYFPQVGVCNDLEDYQRGFELPNEYFKHGVAVLPHDIDANNHCNQSSYIRHCTDALASQPATSSIARFNDMTICHIALYYSGESVLGDSLDVCFWQSPTASDELMFVTLNGHKPILHCTIQYTKRIQFESAAKL